MSISQELAPTTNFAIVCQIEILDANGNPTGIISDVLPGGTVTIDATAEVQRSCNFQCLDPTGVLIPAATGTGGLLQPDGVEVRISVGYAVDNDAVLWPVGVFEIQEDDTTDAGGEGATGPIISVTGNDRSQKISESIWPDAFNITAGTVLEGVSAILADRAPWIKATNIAPSDFELAAQTYQPGDDPWQQIQALATAAGQVAYFDASGVLVIADNPSTSKKSLELVITDGTTNLASKVTSTITNSPGYNGVIVTGSNLANATVSGSAYDMDPNSPTYALGPYGKRAAPPVESSSATTVQQCQAQAAVLLPQVLGLTRQVVADVIPVPFLDVYDLVQVTNSRCKVKGVYITQQATIPLDYSEIETWTGVPLGTPLGQLNGSGDQPSIAEFAPTTPSYSGTFSPYGSSSGNGNGLNTQGLTNIFQAGFVSLFVGAGILRVGQFLNRGNLTQVAKQDGEE